MFIIQLISNPVLAILYLVAIIIAVSLHEYAHAYTADRLGDPTPSLQGRLTVNPRAHLDRYGSIFFLIAGFGWGKPVEFDPFNLRNPRRDAAVISLAGPGMNFLIAVISSILLHFLPLSGILPTFLSLLIMVNVRLGVFNLLPIHPLDGFKIVGGVLSDQQAREWYQLSSYGFIFLLILMFFPFTGTPLIQTIIGPPINILLKILLTNAPLI